MSGKLIDQEGVEPDASTTGQEPLSLEQQTQNLEKAVDGLKESGNQIVRAAEGVPVAIQDAAKQSAAVAVGAVANTTDVAGKVLAATIADGAEKFNQALVNGTNNFQEQLHKKSESSLSWFMEAASTFFSNAANSISSFFAKKFPSLFGGSKDYPRTVEGPSSRKRSMSSIADSMGSRHNSISGQLGDEAAEAAQGLGGLAKGGESTKSIDPASRQASRQSSTNSVGGRND